MARFDEVNAYYIERVASQIAKIGELTPSSMHILTVMAGMNADIIKINAMLAKVLKMAAADIYRIYNRAMQDLYRDARFERALRETPLSEADKRRLEHYTRSVSRQTAGTLQNLSNTTAVSSAYRRAVDNAVLAVSSGLTDYKAATRESIRQLGYNGLQITYASGHHRRLDTAVRQNIIDGTNQITQNGSLLMGEALGYNAIELSAHMRSAPDHEPIQGRVFLLEEFEKLQNQMPFEDVDGRHYEAIRRPIGEWNCMHIGMSFSTDYSKRKHSDEQLEQWAKDNEKGCTIDGKHYTVYQASQLMRKIETETRRQKDVANAARIAGDDELRKQCQVKINALARKYNAVVSASGLTPRRDRMRVEGFRMVKV